MASSPAPNVLIIICCCFLDDIAILVRQNLNVTFICISLMAEDTEHFF